MHVPLALQLELVLRLGLGLGSDVSVRRMSLSKCAPLRRKLRQSGGCCSDSTTLVCPVCNISLV